MKVYITRDENSLDEDDIILWDRKPAKKKYKEHIIKINEKDIYESITFSHEGVNYLRYHYRTFKKYFGFIPEKGTCTEMNLSLRKK